MISEFNQQITMKSFDLRSLLVGVLLTMIVVVVMLIATSESTPRWEYRIVEGYIRNDFQDQINAAAKDGWEVVSMAVVPNPPNTARQVAVMKRPQSSRPSAWWRFWKK